MSDIWELFSKAQHLHFENGDMLVLTCKQPLAVEIIDKLRKEINKISEGITIVCVDPGIEIRKEWASQLIIPRNESNTSTSPEAL